MVTRGLCAAADAAQEAMLVCSSDNKVIHSNEAAADLFGCPGGELVGRDVSDLVVPKGTVSEDTRDGAARRAEALDIGQARFQNRRIANFEASRARGRRAAGLLGLPIRLH